MTAEDEGWPAIVLQSGPSAARWQAIFDRVADRIQSDTGDATFEQELDAADDLISNAGWDLWLDYATQAPKASGYLKQWWSSASGPLGRAVLMLDALSVREARILLAAAAEHGVASLGFAVRGAPVPTDTGAMASSLGLAQRSQLNQEQLPQSFMLKAPALHTEVCEGLEFGGLASTIPPKTHLFLWHPWLDEVIHQVGDRPRALDVIASQARSVLRGEAFWKLVGAMRQGRTVLIMSDHGWAGTRWFAELPSPVSEPVRAHFGAKRCADIFQDQARLAGGQPVVVSDASRSAIVGRWKWKVPGGMPYATHGGLTLPEVCIPIIELPPL